MHSTEGEERWIYIRGIKGKDYYYGKKIGMYAHPLHGPRCQSALGTSHPPAVVHVRARGRFSLTDTPYSIISSLRRSMGYRIIVCDAARFQSRNRDISAPRGRIARATKKHYSHAIKSVR